MQGFNPRSGGKSTGLALDPTLNPEEMAASFARFGRIHVPGVLTEASARTLHEALAEERLWLCSTTSGGTSIDIPVEHFEQFTPDQAAGFISLAHAEARTGFHYMFDTVRISDAVTKGEALNPAFAAFYAFVNSAAFLDFIRRLTQDDRAVYADAQATRYEAGHYLTRHDDKKPEAGRLYAYVLNLTPDWRSDWGGLLHFIDGDGHVAEAYTPTWNALNLFRVPTDHAVSSVAPFAGGARLSITGWLRDRRPDNA